MSEVIKSQAVLGEVVYEISDHQWQWCHLGVLWTYETDGRNRKLYRGNEVIAEGIGSVRHAIMYARGFIQGEEWLMANIRSGKVKVEPFTRPTRTMKGIGTMKRDKP